MFGFVSLVGAVTVMSLLLPDAQLRQSLPPFAVQLSIKRAHEKREPAGSRVHIQNSYLLPFSAAVCTDSPPMLKTYFFPAGRTCVSTTLLFSVRVTIPPATAVF